MKEFLAKYISKQFRAKTLAQLAGIEDNLLGNYKYQRSSPRAITAVYICKALDKAHKKGLIEIDRTGYPNELDTLDILYIECMKCISKEI